MNRIPSSCQYFLFLLCLLLLCGCGDARRQSIEGTATFDGRPIDKGYIKFIPQNDTRGPAAGANIENGKFAIAAEGGPFAGFFRVEITAMRAGNRKAYDPESDRTVSVMEQYIPAKYNAQSELTATIEAKQSSPLDFPLRSK
jgi:hypothetical protein